MGRFETAGKFGIVALIALVLFLLPGGGNALDVVLAVLSIAFFTLIALLAARLYREHRFTIQSLSTLERTVGYVSIGMAILAFVGTSRLFGFGGPGVLIWLALLGACSYGIYWVWRHSTQYS